MPVAVAGTALGPGRVTGTPCRRELNPKSPNVPDGGTGIWSPSSVAIVRFVLVAILIVGLAPTFPLTEQCTKFRALLADNKQTLPRHAVLSHVERDLATTDSCCWQCCSWPPQKESDSCGKRETGSFPPRAKVPASGCVMANAASSSSSLILTSQLLPHGESLEDQR